MLSPSFFRTFRGKSGPCLQFFLQPQPEICKRMHFQYPHRDYNASQCTTEVPFPSLSVFDLARHAHQACYIVLHCPERNARLR